mmetsp:Transcript_25594/g.52523  ORF Transcript_25594/g.52523 Transcript_25594/m.52523 type:complete len:101 (+) Transcript_25594:675-977(+)
MRNCINGILVCGRSGGFEGGASEEGGDHAADAGCDVYEDCWGGWDGGGGGACGEGGTCTGVEWTGGCLNDGTTRNVACDVIIFWTSWSEIIGENIEIMRM